MKKIIIAIILLLLHAGSISISAQPKYEIRAAWITTAYGLDWPRTRANSPEGIRKQKEELIEILDQLQEANFNTVLFQARTRGDVLYRSDIEPFNAILTGNKDGYPGYDPLAFAIEECHRRGMECHAWLVAIPLGSRRHAQQLGKKAVIRRHPEICVSYNRQYFLNPGHPKTKEYLMNIVQEIVTRYDIDGIHLDYLRYPNKARNFPDRTQYRKLADNRNLEQWRRDNLTEILRYIYKGVKRLKAWVKVSTSPVGKYRDVARYSSKGWNAFHSVHQDVQGWLGEGIQDQIYPMLYFKGNNFYPFVLDWQEQSNGRQVVPGLGVYFLDPSEGNWSIDEVERQMNFIRSHQLAGQAHYRAKYIMDNTQNLCEMLETDFYVTKALQPPMTWLDSIAPSSPDSLQAKVLTTGYTLLTWHPSVDNDRLNKPTYVIYASDKYPVDTDDPHNIIASGIANTEYLYAPLYPWQRHQYFSVTAVDRYGNESESAQTTVALSPIYEQDTH